MNPRFGVFVLATAVLHTEAKSKNLTSFRGQLEGHAQEAFRDRQRSGGIQQQGKRRGSWTAGPRNETSRLMKRKKSLLIFRFAWKGTPPVQQAFDRWRTLCANRGRSWQTARLRSFTQFSLSFLPGSSSLCPVSGQDLAAGPPQPARLVPSSLRQSESGGVARPPKAVATSKGSGLVGYSEPPEPNRRNTTPAEAQ